MLLSILFGGVAKRNHLGYMNLAGVTGSIPDKTVLNRRSSFVESYNGIAVVDPFRM